MASRILLLGASAGYLLKFRDHQIRELVSRGWHVAAAAPDMDQDNREGFRSLGARAITIPIARNRMNPIADLATLSALQRLLATERPDTLLSIAAKPVIWGSIAARRAQIPRVVGLIAGLGYAFTDAAGLRRRLARAASTQLYRVALKRCDTVIFQNSDDQKEFGRLGLTRGVETIVVAGSGVDLESFTPAPLPSTPSFLMAARLLRDKGVREYAEAAAIVRAEYPDVSVRLAGPTDSSPNAVDPRDLTRWSGGALDYLGALEDVRPAIAGASVYVLPSYREGTPRSTLEAMAMGRPVITTDAPGCRDTVRDGKNGLLITPRSATALAAAMRRLVVQPDAIATMGAESRRMAESRFDVRAVTSDIISVLEGARGP